MIKIILFWASQNNTDAQITDLYLVFFDWLHTQERRQDPAARVFELDKPGCPNGGAKPQERSVAGFRGGNSQHFPTKTLFLRGPQVIV